MRKTKRSVKSIFIVALAGCLAFAANAADLIIHLRNGDRLTGKIVGESPTEVTLQTPTLGKITIPVGQILKREEIVATNVTAAATSTNTFAGTTTTTNAPTTAPKTPVVS